LRRACLEHSPGPVAVDGDAVHHPVLAAGLADELPKKYGTGQPPLAFPVIVLRRSPVNRRSKVLPGQCLRALQTQFLHAGSDGLKIVRRSGSGHVSSIAA
jgi:hypothetical protein